MCIRDRNKLAVQVQGKALFHRALEAVPAEQFDRTVVVSQYPEVLELAHRMGFVPVPNRHPDWGISHTISLGLGKLPEMDAALGQVADQPLLRRESVGSLSLIHISCQRAGECRTLSVWQGYYDLTRKYFSGITLADLMAVPQGDNYVI